MILRITNPTDEFDQLEVLNFSYRSTKGQSVIKTLTITAVKFLTTLDNKYVYSDDPPVDIYVPNVDKLLQEDADAGRTTTMEALEKCFEVVAELYTDSGLTVEVQEA